MYSQKELKELAKLPEYMLTEEDLKLLKKHNPKLKKHPSKFKKHPPELEFDDER